MRYWSKLPVLAVFAIISLSFTPQQSVPPHRASALQQLDPRLQILQQQFQRAQRITSTSVELHSMNTKVPAVGVVLQTRGDAEAPLKKPDDSNGSLHGEIHTAR